MTVKTAVIAGNLMTLGNILVPEKALTRSGQLSTEEIRQVPDSLEASGDLLADIEFDGPVVVTLRQIQERWGGTAGLSEDNIYCLPASSPS